MTAISSRFTRISENTMTVKYKTVITKAGAIKLAAATVPNGKKVNFTAMAIGDGGGTLPVPDASQT